MRISRILVPKTLIEGSLLEVEGEISHYLKTVLRVRKGWKLTVFDGQGIECPATVETFGRDSASLRLETPQSINRESPLFIHLALGISRAERMDLSIQKAVELGVQKITPLMTKHSVVHLDEARQSHKLKHWQGIVRSSCEQSGRNVLPMIDPPAALSDWLETREREGLALIFDPQQVTVLSKLSTPTGSITLLLGPEGGFAEDEIENARRSDFRSVSLGPRILRAETATMAAITAVQTLWGDLR